MAQTFPPEKRIFHLYQMKETSYAVFYHRRRTAMAKKAKAKKSRSKSAAKPEATKPVSKVQRVLEMVSTDTGCTLDEIMQELSVSRSAASSLIGDLRRKGKAVNFDNGTYKL